MKYLFAIFFLSFSVLAHNPKLHSPLKIVTTFSILGDFVQEIGKDKVVISIVGPNSDAHTYQPTPKDVCQISKADLVFVNGLGFEGWIDRLIESSGYKGPITVATQGISPLMINDPGEAPVPDPHAWNTIDNAKVYVKNILTALIQLDPEQKEYYQKNYEAYLEKLNALEGEIKTSLQKVPQENRKIITAHDAFGYYGDKYGVTFLAPVGTNTADEPSAKEMAKLVEEIKKNKIKIIFVENITNKKLIQQLAEETGAEIGPEIYSDALSEKNQPGHSYLALMRHNTRQFVRAMVS